MGEHQRKLACRLYVGSLHYDVKESDIRGIFSPFGTIAQIDMSFDQGTGKSKGFCFVEFAGTMTDDGLLHADSRRPWLDDISCVMAVMCIDPDHARRALENMQGFTLAGRQIKVGRPSNMVAGMTGPSGIETSQGTAVSAEGLAQATAVAHDVNSFLQAQVTAQGVHLTNVSKTG